MKLKEYLDREPTGRAFIDVVMYLNTRDKRKPMPDRATLGRIRHDAIFAHGGDVSGLEDIVRGFRKEEEDDIPI